MIYLLILLSIGFADIRDSIVLSLEKNEYNKITSLRAQNDEERLVLALAYIKQNNTKEANTLLKQINKPYPKGYYYVLGLINEVYKKDRQAEILFNNSIKKQEYVYKSKIELGRLKRKQNHLDIAISYWNIVLSEPLISKNERSQIHFLIAESLYNKYRYQNLTDKSILDDAIMHIDRIEDRQYKERGEILRRFINKLYLGHINSEDAKDVQLALITDLGFANQSRFYLIDWQKQSYTNLLDKFLFSKIFGSFYYSPIRNHDGSLRAYFGLELSHQVFTDLDTRDNISFWDLGFGTKLKWETYHKLMAFSLSYLSEFKFVNFTNSQYLGLNHKISLLLEYLINQYFYVFLDFPFKLFSLGDDTLNLDSGHELAFGMGVYFLYDWFKVGTSAYYSMSSTSFESGSGYKINTLLAFNFLGFETGFKYKLKSINFDTGVLQESTIGGFISYKFTGNFALSLFANALTNTSLNSQSLYTGLNINLAY